MENLTFPLYRPSFLFYLVCTPCTPMFMKFNIQFIQVLLEANGLAAGKDHQFKGRYDAEKNAVIISLETDEQEK